MWNDARLLNVAASVLMAAALVLYVGEAVRLVTQLPFFDLHGVHVEGDGGELEHVNVATVRAATLPRISGNFFGVDLEQVRHAFEGVAWVRHARVRRQWPNRLDVVLEEHQALGFWNDGRLIDVDGDVFAANLAEADADGTLPALSGPEGSEHEVAQRYSDFSRWLQPLGLQLASVSLSRSYAWSVKVANGTADGLTIEFGRERDPDALAERAARLAMLYPLIVARWPHPTHIDLRYPNGLALAADGLKLATPTQVGAHVAAMPPHAGLNVSNDQKANR